MNSYPWIENLSCARSINDDTQEMSVLPHGECEGEDEWQKVDSYRLARISRGQARYEGALSEAPIRVGQLLSDLAY
jgi:hypothetical protein